MDGLQEVCYSTGTSGPMQSCIPTYVPASLPGFILFFLDAIHEKYVYLLKSWNLDPIAPTKYFA